MHMAYAHTSVRIVASWMMASASGRVHRCCCAQSAIHWLIACSQFSRVTSLLYSEMTFSLTSVSSAFERLSWPGDVRYAA